MTVLTIRAHCRYAVRRPVRLTAAGTRAAPGLLIELSAEGCRISGLGNTGFAAGQRVAIHLDPVVLTGRVRWAHDGLAGIRLDSPLRAARLSELVLLSRGEAANGLRRYGT